MPPADRPDLQSEPLRSSAVVKAFKARMAEEGKSRCQVCRWKPPTGLAELHDDPSSMLQAHHVIPIACRGMDVEPNLLLVCPTHHAIAHKLGRMEQNARWGLVWVGPATPAQLLREIRLLEKDPAGWTQYVGAGRNYEALLSQDAQTEAERRRGAFRVHTTTKSTTCEIRPKNGAEVSNAVTLNA